MAYRDYYSGLTTYGSKVWHSTDKYRRVIWQCNSKFKDKTRCQTPHLTEDEIREAFIRVVNSLITDRKEVLTELRTVRDMLTGTEELEKEQKKLAEQMNVDADAVQNIIAENARVAQNQEEYTIRYDALVSRFEATKAEYEKTTADISARGIRRRELERFIQSVEKLPEMVTEFDEALWGSLVDHLTVNAKDDIDRQRKGRHRLHPDKRNGDRCINTERQPCFFGGGAFLRFGTGKERRGMLK